MEMDKIILKKWQDELKKETSVFGSLETLISRISLASKSKESQSTDTISPLSKGVVYCTQVDAEPGNKALKILLSICVNELKEAHTNNNILREGEVLETLFSLRKSYPQFKLIANQYNSALHDLAWSLTPEEDEETEETENGVVAQETAAAANRALASQFLRKNVPIYPTKDIKNVSQIGSSSVAVTHIAKLKGIPDFVVVKTFFGKRLPADKKKMANEMIFLTSAFSNPYIVKIIGFVGEVDRPLLGRAKRPEPIGVIMEFCKDGNLARAIHDSTVSYNPIQLALQATSGLASLHKKGVIHRNLTTSNMLLHENWTILKISDFGHAKEENNAHTIVVISKTYLAPEMVLKNHNYSSKIDVYSLGVIIVEMVLRDIMPETPNLMAQKAEEIECKELKELCLKMLSVDPKDRPSMQEVYEQLEKISKKFPK